MKPDWDKLGDEFAGSLSVMIGDVDCTADGESLCKKYDIKGYPSIKYFVDGDTEGKDYSGGRDFDSLLQHARDNLEIMCDVENPSDCTDKEKGYIAKMREKTSDERKAQLNRLQGMQGQSMKAELKQWLNQRLHILTRLEAGISQEL